MTSTARSTGASARRFITSVLRRHAERDALHVADHLSRSNAVAPRTPARSRRCAQRRTREEHSSGPTMPPWTSSGLTRLEPAGADALLDESRASVLSDARDVAERGRRRGARRPRRFRGTRSAESAAGPPPRRRWPRRTRGACPPAWRRTRRRARTRARDGARTCRAGSRGRAPALLLEVVVDHRLVHARRRGRCGRRWRRRSRGRRTRRRRPRTAGHGSGRAAARRGCRRDRRRGGAVRDGRRMLVISRHELTV